jgi:type VI secretion system secreted protein Hcp
MPIYMKIPGVKGTGKGKYDGWIELESAGPSVSGHITASTGAGSDREATAPSRTEIVVTKRTDNASPDLVRLSQRGQGMKVTIEYVAGDSRPPAPYRSIELTDAIITGYVTHGHGGAASARPFESLTLNFNAITVTNTPGRVSTDTRQLPDRALWDLASGARGS